MQKKFEVYSLDMLPDVNGRWVENERQKIGGIEVECNEESLPRALLNALRDVTCRDITGREHPVLLTTDRRRVYIEDYYGTGEWWEVGEKKGRKPFLGLRLAKEVV